MAHPLITQPPTRHARQLPYGRINGVTRFPLTEAVVTFNMAYSELPGSLAAPSSLITAIPSSLIADTHTPPPIPSATHITIYPSSTFPRITTTASTTSLVGSAPTAGAGTDSTPSSSPTSSSNSSSSGGLSTGAIIAIVVVPIVLIAIAGAFLFWFCTRRRRRNREASDSTTKRALVENGVYGSASTGATGRTGGTSTSAGDGMTREKPLPTRPARPSETISPKALVPPVNYTAAGMLPPVARSPAFPNRAFEPPRTSFYSETSTPPSNGAPTHAGPAHTSSPLTAANLTQYQSASHSTSGVELDSHSSPFDDPVGASPSREGTAHGTHDASSFSDASAPTTHGLRDGIPGEATRSLTGQPLSSPLPAVQQLMYGAAGPSSSSQPQPPSQPAATKDLPARPTDRYRLPSLQTEGNYPFSPASTHPGHISRFEGNMDDEDLEAMSPVSDMSDENPEYANFPGVPPPLPRSNHPLAPDTGNGNRSPSDISGARTQHSMRR